MNPEQENFDSLRKLLALKRHEQPPPGYFDHFSSNVIHGIREARHAERQEGIPWLQRFWALLEAQPLLAGGVGVGACALMILGVLYSDPGNFNLQMGSGQVAVTAAAAPADTMPVFGETQTPFAGFSSTNGGLLPASTQGSLFQPMGAPHFQLVSDPGH